HPGGVHRLTANASTFGDTVHHGGGKVRRSLHPQRQGKPPESLATYTHPHVLIIDEVGYLTYAQDAANVLFHVVNNRHLHKRPMIFTTNKPLNEWGKVLHDEDLAAAILDRVLERGRFVRLDGPSG